MDSSPDAQPLHYTGQELVLANSFLRTVPDVVSGPERLRLDALAFSGDALCHGWNTLREIAAHVGSDPSKLTSRLRAAMMVAAWSIVDHLNVVRQIVRSLGPSDQEPGPLTKQLLSVTETARVLRNKMDHLNANAANIAKAKGLKSALFGSLSYFFTDKPEDGGYVVLIQTGMLHGSEQWNIVNPAGRTLFPPADMFELSAFGETLALGPPIAAFDAWLKASVPGWEEQLDVEIAKLAETTGKSVEELKGHRGGGYMFALAIKFNEKAVPNA